MKCNAQIGVLGRVPNVDEPGAFQERLYIANFPNLIFLKGIIDGGS
jgi:hypothetical protein